MSIVESAVVNKPINRQKTYLHLKALKPVPSTSPSLSSGLGPCFGAARLQTASFQFVSMFVLFEQFTTKTGSELFTCPKWNQVSGLTGDLQSVRAEPGSVWCWHSTWCMLLWLTNGHLRCVRNVPSLLHFHLICQLLYFYVRVPTQGPLTSCVSCIWWFSWTAPSLPADRSCSHVLKRRSADEDPVPQMKAQGLLCWFWPW